MPNYRCIQVIGFSAIEMNFSRKVCYSVQECDRNARFRKASHIRLQPATEITWTEFRD